MDWLRKLFNQPETLVAFISSGVIGLFVGAANGVIQRKHGGWGGFFGAVLTGVCVAILVGFVVQDYIKSETLRLAIVGACAVISDDIWNGLKTFGAGLRTDPLGSISRLIDALRGRSSSPPTPTHQSDPVPMRRYEEER